MDGDDDDDLFASLGGALMKNLLADLNGDEGGGGLLSLEELEQELAHLDDHRHTAAPPVAIYPSSSNTAASLVVRAQEQQQQANFAMPMTTTTVPVGASLLSQPLDAWSLSLEKFTAASLQEDFLQADSARKAKSAATATATPTLSQQYSGMLQNAEEYDVSEPLLLSPPPGLPKAPTTTPSTAGAVAGLRSSNNTVPTETSSSAMSNSLVQQLTLKLETVVDRTAREEVWEVGDEAEQTAASLLLLPPQSVPPPRAFPRTPANSMTFNLPKPQPITPQNSIAHFQPPGLGGSSDHGSTVIIQSVIHEGKMAPPQPPTPPNTVHSPRQVVLTGSSTLPPGVMGAPMISSPPVAGALGMVMPPGTVPPPHMMMMQQPQQQQAPPTISPPVFSSATPMIRSNPHPAAPPIPASELASKYMSSRDITYVVHAILKPILNHQQLNPPSPFDYERAFWQKAAGIPPAGPTANRGNSNKLPQTVEDEIESRDKKAQSWQAEHHTLGRTAKSQVTRPRALIAQPTKKEGNDADKNSNLEQRQRQALWKARIYCDQAYQAYLKVVETWHMAHTQTQGGGMTAEIAAVLQPHLFKLLKCLGMARTEQQQQSYAVVNDTALPLLIKLPKGRTLVARVLEQALLPPTAVCVLLPPLLQSLYEIPSSSAAAAAAATENSAELAAARATAQFVENRLFSVITRVFQTLSDLPGSEILKALDVVQEHSTVALNSPIRMQAVHALLERGTQLAAVDANFAPAWHTKEDTFMQILSGN